MKNRVPIIELVGPPGSGKTTLTNFQRRRADNVRVQPYPYFRRLRDGPFFIRNTLNLLPTFLQLYHPENGGLSLTGREVIQMTILQGWPCELERIAARSRKAVILEEGGVRLLARLQSFGAEPLKSDVAKMWWDDVYRRWAELLDIIVILEASTSTLLQRVRSRGQQYEIGGMTDEEAVTYLESIRAAEQRVVSALATAPCSPRILYFDTETCPPQLIDIGQMVR